MSYNKLLYHIIFRPHNSVPAIAVESEEDFYRYVWAFVKNRNGVLYRIGGMPDHVHLLLQLPTNVAISTFMHDLKLATNKFMMEHKDKFPLFCGWGKSYCALTCSDSVKENIVNYIKNQKEHHRRTTFKEELLALLEENGVEVDMRYFMQ